MKTNHLPPCMKTNEKVILFDGVCKLCNGWAKFILKYDKSHEFKMASVQSKQGQAILAFFELPIDKFETMLMVDEDKAYVKSDAFFQVVKRLPYRFRFVMIFKLIPRPIRDWLYDRVALNRYTLFGKHDHCMMALPEYESRFLE